MPTLDHLWLGTVTASNRTAGTDNRIVLIVNVGGNRADNVHKTFPDTSQSDLERDQANIYEVKQDDIDTVNGFQPGNVDTDSLNPSSLRIGIRGSNAWVPKTAFVWGREQRDGGQVVPLGLVVNLRPSIFFAGTLADITLSTDSSEGPLSFPIPRVTPGGASMVIRSLLVAMITADEDDAGTDDPIQLRITTVDGRLVVDHVFSDTAQNDQEEGEANLYFVPVDTPFTKAELGERSIELAIRGDDAWLPASFFVFGLVEEQPTAFSTEVEPLVHLASWPFSWLSSDDDEGKASVVLPVLLP